MNVKKKTNDSRGRFNTSTDVKMVVWIRAAGHCELCGTDLTHDFRIGTPMKWGEVAHILPASPKGPRGNSGHSEEEALARTNDSENLMLLCPGCHNRVDRDGDNYPEDDLSGLHSACLTRIRLAASTPGEERAIPVIVQSQHHQTLVAIPAQALLTAMSAEGLTAQGHPVTVVFPEPSSRGRDAGYWQAIKDLVTEKLEAGLARRGGQFGDKPALAMVGLADIPALFFLGQTIGDRYKRFQFSFNREHMLRWPDMDAPPPTFCSSELSEGEGPVALVLSISAVVPRDDVIAALPDARIVEFTIPEPSYAMVTNRRVIHMFRDELQKLLSQLEAATTQAIHVFAAVPAVLAIEFGALLTTQHQHSYIIFDRDKNNANQFRPMLTIGCTKEQRP
ncbi:SAVED domain-containing protein [Enterobacter bugandensis]|uniref:SAVED domain-containing protein n=1 Tax=Enterobacter bugandensis TaxID=881260 RepID=UPI0021D3E28D|nr:SAVED domain-containing protein [Enterobacter bugandensis]